MKEKKPDFEIFTIPGPAIIIDKPLPKDTSPLTKLITRAEKYTTKKDQK